MESAYLSRGSLYASRSETALALADFEKAISLNPRSALGYFNRGLIKTQQSDAAGALRDFDQALAFDSHLAAKYSKESVRKHAEELMKDVAIGTHYEHGHHDVPISERIKRARNLLGVQGDSPHSTKQVSGVSPK